MVLRCSVLAFATALLLASSSDTPPDSLIRENVRKSSVILKGQIESFDAPRPGLTVAHFRVSRSYRGAVKSGELVDFASFKEGDRYPEQFLKRDLIVFLRKRQSRYAPPKWETATDLSEFPFTSELEAKVASPTKGEHH
jgi:hypothetical protein